MNERADLIVNLRQIDRDLDRVEAVWLLFEKSTKDFGDEQGAFVDLVNESGIGTMFSMMQTILLHDCIAAICRITDHSGPNRVTLLGAMAHANSLYASERSSELAPISQALKTIRHSTEMDSLRRFRDQHIAHTLSGDSFDTQHKAIPVVAAQISGVVGALYSMCGGSRWIGQASKAVQDERARRFWGYLEMGMKHAHNPMANG